LIFVVDVSRRSKQKEAILRCLRATKSHPNATWIYEEVRKEIPKISLGTVYRNLRLMSERGEIQEMDLGGDHSRFDGNAQNHYHFECEVCGRIFDVEEPIDRDIDERVSRNTGFQVVSHRLEFCGLCLDCRDKS
jgi:Fur family peroxide stress response transcriptional regulator